MALTKAKASNILLTTPAASSNDTTPATTQYVTTAIANLIDNAPANLNTLNELAAAMADNASFFSTVLPLSGGTMTGGLTLSGASVMLLDSGNNEQSVRIQNSTVSAYLGVEGSSANRFIGSAANNMFLGTTTADGIEFATNNTVRAVIDNSGKVGIGITSGMDRDLHIKGSGSDVGIQIEKTGVAELRVAVDSTGPYLYAEGTVPLRFYQNNAEIVRISGGNVGIGDAPASFANAALHVAKDMGNSVTAVARLRGRNTTARTTRLQFEDYSGAIADGLIDFHFPNAGSNTGAYFGMGYNAGNQLAINSSGNVGIGTTDPKRMLQVGNNTQAIAALSLQATTTGKSRIYMGDNDNTSGEYEGLISYDHNVNNLEVWSGGGNRMTILGTSQSNSHVDIHGGVNLGIGNTTAAGDTGMNVKGWYNATAHSSNTYLHLNTSLWGGGSPYGNGAYIMGGWEITGHQYATNASHGKCNVFFHNWNGSVGNGYSLNYTGLYTGWCHVYVNSSGYVTIRLSAGSYKAYWLDYYQAPHYPARNTYVTAATFSNSATL